MTPKETGAVMDILTGAYPRFFSPTTDRTRQMAVWATMFRDDALELVLAAVKALIVSDEKGYPPTIGAVKSKMRQLLESEQETELEAWSVVRRAISRSGYNSKDEYEKLPKELQRLVGSPEQLKQWAMMDSNTVESVIGSNFQRSYRERKRQADEWKALPNDVKAVASNLSQRLALEDINT